MTLNRCNVLDSAGNCPKFTDAGSAPVTRPLQLVPAAPGTVHGVKSSFSLEYTYRYSNLRSKVFGTTFQSVANRNVCVRWWMSLAHVQMGPRMASGFAAAAVGQPVGTVPKFAPPAPPAMNSRRS